MRHPFVLLAGLCACTEPAVEITAEHVETAAQSVILTTKVPYWDVVPPTGQPPATGYTGVLPGEVLRVNATSPVYVELANPSYCAGHESIVKIESGFGAVLIHSDGGAPIDGYNEHIIRGEGASARFLSVGDSWLALPAQQPQPYFTVDPPAPMPPYAGTVAAPPATLVRVDATLPVHVELADPSSCLGHEVMIKEDGGGHESITVTSESGYPVNGNPQYIFMQESQPRRFVSVGSGWTAID